MVAEFSKQVLVEITNFIADLPFRQVNDTIEKLEKALVGGEDKDTVSLELDQTLLNVIDSALSQAPYKQAKPLYDYINALLKQQEPTQAQQEHVQEQVQEPDARINTIHTDVLK